MQVDAVLLLAAFTCGLASGAYIENKIIGTAIDRIHKTKEEALSDLKQGRDTDAK